MKKILLFSLLFLLAFPVFLMGEAKKGVSAKKGKGENEKLLPAPQKKEVSTVSPSLPGKEKKKEIQKKIPPVPPAEKKEAKKSLEEEFFGKLPKIINAVNSDSPLIAKLWKEELEKDPVSFIKRILETEKSGIRVLPAGKQLFSNTPQRPPRHLLLCRECGKKFKVPPFLHAHRLKNNILLIKINKWDRATGSHVGNFLKKAAPQCRYLLWDLRDCRGIFSPGVIQILSHLKKYGKPSALLVSENTRGSAELFAKMLQNSEKDLLSAGTKTAGLPFLMTKKELTLSIGKSQKKETFTLLLPRIPHYFRKMTPSPFQPGIQLNLHTYYHNHQDLALHHLCDLLLARSILEKGKK